MPKSVAKIHLLCAPVEHKNGKCTELFLPLTTKATSPRLSSGKMKLVCTNHCELKVWKSGGAVVVF